MFCRILVVITELHPRRLHTEVHDPGPSQSIPSFGKSFEIKFLQPLELLSIRFVGDSFVLHGPLISFRHPSYNEGDAWILPKIPDFSVGFDRVEKEFEVVGDDKSDNGCLG